jgi:hypothetical protein
MKNDVETHPLGKADKVDRPKPILVKQAIVPKRSLSIRVGQVIYRRNRAIEVGVVVATVGAMDC